MKFEDGMLFVDERAARTGSWRAAAARHVRCVRGGLARGAAARARLQLRPRAPRAALQLLAYYTTGLRARPYRLLRHVFRFKVLVSTAFTITTCHICTTSIVRSDPIMWSARCTTCSLSGSCGVSGDSATQSAKCRWRGC